MTLLVASGGSPPVAAGAQAAARPTDDRPPRLALVLSGGGARGAAHIGVLRVLEEKRIPVDLVIGTSIGAIVGGLWASGLSADEIEGAIAGLDWQEAFRDKPQRRLRPFRRKQDERGFRVRTELRFEDGSLRLPEGALEGRRILSVLRRLTLPVATRQRFDDLPIPFRAVATDLATGEAVVLDEGDLALALRASMSIPGAFVPVEIDGRLLVDGGVAENLPVSVARDLGAEAVLAVDISTPLFGVDELENVLDVVLQTLTILTRRQADRSAELLGEGDVLITPELGDIATADFSRAIEAVGAGEAAARGVEDRLAEWSLDEGAWQSWQSARTKDGSAPVIEHVDVELEGGVDRSVVRERLKVETGRPLDAEALIGDLERIAGLDLFDRIDFTLRPGESGGADLVVRAAEKERRAERLRLGLELRDDLEGSEDWGLGGRFTATGLNHWAAELRLDAVVGEQQRVEAELYQPIGGGVLFVAPRAAWEARPLRLFLDGLEAVETRLESWRWGLDVGSELGSWGELRLGFEELEGQAEIRIGIPGLPDRRIDERRLTLGLLADTQDAVSFPSSGMRSRFEVSRFLDGTDGGDDETLLSASWDGAFSLGRFRLVPGLEAGSLLDDALEIPPFSLGGAFRLSSLQSQELFGDQLFLARLLGYREVGGESLLRMPLFLGASLETGNVWKTRDEFDLGDLSWSASLFVGADTYLGPALLGFAYGERDRHRFFLLVGRSF